MRLWLLIIWAIFAACGNKQVAHTFQATAALDSLADQFVADAARRGHKIDLASSGLTMLFGKLGPTENAHCSPSSFPKTITIDSAKWESYSPAFKEYIVYHELAHCLLNRTHAENNALELGECRSWMRKGNTECMVDFLDKTWRGYYLDELFNPGTGLPNWYRPHEKSINLTEATLIASFHPNEFGYRLDSVELLRDANWTILATVQHNIPEACQMILWFDNIVMEESFTSLYPIEKGFVEKIAIDRFNPVRSWQQMHVSSLFSYISSEPSKEILISVEREDQSIFLFVNHQLRHCYAMTDINQCLNLHFAMKGNSCSLEIFQNITHSERENSAGDFVTSSDKN